ncbi:MAG: hypothetical protein K1X79_02640 [Oligoflexia bacterium]|nr:hypothetical protein [Oligoflexia bacterium]
MKISVFVPFGSQSQESGLMYLLANYLKAFFPEVVQLRCNGAFSLCDRDADSSWTRNIVSCFTCMNDQRALSSWSGIPVQDLSSFLSPDDISQTKRWALALTPANFQQAALGSTKIFELCRESFMNRFGFTEPDPANKNHEQFLRRLLLATARMVLAARRYHMKFAPDLSLISGGGDFLTRTFQSEARACGRDVALFHWEVAQRAIQIHHPRERKMLACELVPEGIRGMRSDTKTWPHELVTIMAEIMKFLDLEGGQLRLPIAQ